MGVRPVSIVRRLDDRRIRRGQCVYGLPLNDISLADGCRASANFGAIFLVVAGLCASWAILAWRTRSTPLSIETGGRVSYGERELCAAGTVRAVRIVESVGGEPGDSEVVLEVAGGKMVSIPSRYFASFKSRKHARPFAAKLAQALEVQVLESP